MHNITREQFLAQINEKLHNKQAIIGAGAGIGISAKCQAIAGVDFISVNRANRFQVSARNEVGAVFAYGKANDELLDMGREIIPVADRVPLFAGVMACDPNTDLDSYLKKLMDMGFSGIQNYPSVGDWDELNRVNLDKVHLGYTQEAEMIQKAHEMGFITAPFCWYPDQAQKMAEAGADIIIAHMGIVPKELNGEMIGNELEQCVALCREIASVAKSVNPNIAVLCHGGAIRSYEAAAHMLHEVKDLSGFFGGDTFESVPIERAISGNIMALKKAKLRVTGTGV